MYIDFSLQGKSIPLELVRSYNSITASNEQTGWSGAFGWGWTTPFETTLTTTPERHAILRDGASGNTVLFKPEKEDPKAREEFYADLKRAYFERTKSKKYSDADLKKLNLPEKISSKLKSDPQFRAEMAAKYGVKTTVPKGELLISSEYGYQTLQFKNNQWIREKDGVTQLFDSEGRMTRQSDKNGAYLQYKYSASSKLLAEISDQDRTMSLKFTWRQDRVVEIVDNRSHKARYAYDSGGNLLQATDSNGQTYVYKYENKRLSHLLTRIEYPTESTKEKVFREIHYDDNGLVVYHRDKDTSEISFTYGKGSDPETTFWTKSNRKFRGATEEVYDEYQVKIRADGSKYLHRQEDRQGGVTTVTVFTSCCGKPQQVTKNGDVTNYKYYENGLLKERTSAKEDIRLEYDLRWKKVNKVTQGGLVSKYDYDDKGNLVRASNNHNENVALKYDKAGRIWIMTDTDGKRISFEYADDGKPTVISEKGVGTIKLAYGADGKIAKTETQMASVGGGGANRRPSDARSQEVVRKVMKGFQQLLDIIRPAGVGLSTG